MAGNPRECREQAASCWVLAETADEQEKQRLSDLAWAWEQLAVEHENAQAFLRTMETVNEGLRAGHRSTFIDASLDRLQLADHQPREGMVACHGDLDAEDSEKQS